MTGKRHGPEANERNRQAHLGKKHSPETIERLRQTSTGRKQSPETIEKLSQRMMGNQYWAGRTHSPESREKLRQANLGKNVSGTTREKLRQARLRQRFPQKMTTLERALFSEFKKRRLRFEMHKTMFGRFQPDFVFENVRLIVQADGDYWHRQSKVNAERDERFNAKALAAEWTVWRFAESEIRQNPRACGKAVARFIHSH